MNSATKTENNISMESPKKMKILNDAKSNSLLKTSDNFFPTEAINFNTCPNEVVLVQRESLIKEKLTFSSVIEEENDKILINESKHLIKNRS